MTRVIVATCGTSVKGTNVWNAVGEVAGALRDPGSGQISLDRVFQHHKVTSLRESVRQFGFDRPLKAGAELASVAAVERDRLDRLMLLASDTDDGQNAAVLVASICGHCVKVWRGDRDGNPCVDSVLASEGELGRLVPRADVVRVRWLDANEPQRFASACKALAWALIEAAKAGDVHLEYHATGGFKATIGLMTELLPYVPGATGRSAWVLYDPEELGDKGSACTAIPLPVRAEDPLVVEEVKEVMKAEEGGPKYNKRCREFDGYLYRDCEETELMAAFRVLVRPVGLAQ
jgi:hypothetical protein